MTRDELQALLDYDPTTGIFRWKITNSPRNPAGNIAGGDDGRGYIKIGINGRTYYAHRLAWLYMTGRWPTDYIDHINRNTSDTRFENLREVDNSRNQMNQNVRITNTSGHTGVSWDSRRSKWEVYIKVNQKRKFLGYYDDLDMAIKARKNGERIYFR